MPARKVEQALPLWAGQVSNGLIHGARSWIEIQRLFNVTVAGKGGATVCGLDSDAGQHKHRIQKTGSWLSPVARGMAPIPCMPVCPSVCLTVTKFGCSKRMFHFCKLAARRANVCARERSPSLFMKPNLSSVCKAFA